MKTAIISSHVLSEFNRWDATFHLAVQSVAPRFRELQHTITPDEARRRLRLLRPTDKQACLILGRGQNPSLEAIEQEYPHLALALVEQTLDELDSRLVSDLQQTYDYRETVKRLVALQGRSAES